MVPRDRLDDGDGDDATAKMTATEAQERATAQYDDTFVPVFDFIIIDKLWRSTMELMAR